MKCSCCGKKKRLFESFEELDTAVRVCVECSKKLYKYQDYMKEKNENEAKKILVEVKGTKNSPEFEVWLDAFLLRFKKEEDVGQTGNSSTESSEKTTTVEE